MKTWIALLRGINVGGRNMLPMKDLRTTLENIGLENVRTYLQSGNCVFESDGSDAPTLAKTIENCIQKKFGFRPQVLVISTTDLGSAISSNPFLQGEVEPKSVHLFFLSEPTRNSDLTKLEQSKSANEHFALLGLVFYLYTPDGFDRSKVAPKVEKVFGVAATARNYRSAVQIFELAAK